MKVQKDKKENDARIWRSQGTKKLLKINYRFGSWLCVAKVRREMESMTWPHVVYKEKIPVPKGKKN